MERIEVSGVPARIGTKEEHDAEVHGVNVCYTCGRMGTSGHDGVICTIRLVATDSGRLHPMEVDENDTCDLHTDLQPDVGEEPEPEVRETPARGDKHTAPQAW